MYREIGKHHVRKWRPDDAGAIVRYANNIKIWRHLRDAFPHPYRIEDAAAFISRANAADPVTFFAIATASEAIGGIGLMPGKDVRRFTAEIGYWLAEPYWNKGIMTETVQCVTAWAFQELKLHRVSAAPYAVNRASHRVLEKAGFIREGVLRSSVFKDGRILDQALYSRIALDV